MSEPIRVLHVVGNMGIGGIETLIMNIYRNIDRDKVQFDFLIHNPTEGEYAEEIKNKILLDPILSKTTAVTSDRVFPLYPHRSQFIIQDITNVLQLIYNYDWPLHMGTILCADE